METKFANGLIFKEPKLNSPDFIKGSLSIKVDEFIKFLQDNNNNGWVNVDMKLSKAGKTYFALNEWKPNEDMSTATDRGTQTNLGREEDSQISVDSIPF